MTYLPCRLRDQLKKLYGSSQLSSITMAGNVTCSTDDSSRCSPLEIKSTQDSDVTNYQPFYFPDLLNTYCSVWKGDVESLPLSDWSLMNDQHKFANGIVFIDSLISNTNSFAMNERPYIQTRQSTYHD